MWAELVVDGKRRILASGANWTKKKWGKGEGAISTPFLGVEPVSVVGTWGEEGENPACVCRNSCAFAGVKWPSARYSYAFS